MPGAIGGGRSVRHCDHLLFNRCVEFHKLEDHIACHNFGETGHAAAHVRFASSQYLTRLAVHYRLLPYSLNNSLIEAS